jgi:ABC-type Na+ efflux pump permease subunit
MSIESRDLWKIGIWFLLLAFVFVAIILPLLTTDTPDAVTAVTFTLILILEILFALSLNPQQLVCTAYHFGIPPRSPPNR